MRLLGRIAPVAFAALLIGTAIVLYGELEGSSPPSGEGGPRGSAREEREAARRRERDARRLRGALVPAPRAYRRLIGREVEARAVIVQSVVEGSGFWIGPDRSQRVLVLTREGDLVPRRRARVDVDGLIVAADAGTGRALRLDADDRSTLRRVRALIEARRVRRAAAGR